MSSRRSWGRAGRRFTGAPVSRISAPARLRRRRRTAPSSRRLRRACPAVPPRIQAREAGTWPGARRSLLWCLRNAGGGVASAQLTFAAEPKPFWRCCLAVVSQKWGYAKCSATVLTPAKRWECDLSLSLSLSQCEHCKPRNCTLECVFYLDRVDCLNIRIFQVY